MVSIPGKKLLKDTFGFSLFLNFPELAFDERTVNLKPAISSKEIKWP